MCSIGGNCYGEKDGFGFQSDLLLSHLDEDTKISRKIKEFMTILSVCHTVIPEKKKENGSDEKISYYASSPDEGALVGIARDLGFVFHTRTPEHVIVDISGQCTKFYILSVLEFTSERKRMGVVVKTEEGNIRLFVKGADSTILPRLSTDCDRQVVISTLNNLRRFANNGELFCMKFI